MNRGLESLTELFRQAAWEVAGKKWDVLAGDTRIRDLGIDSVALLEIIGCLEEELSVEVPDEAIARVDPLRDLAQTIDKLLPGTLETPLPRAV